MNKFLLVLRINKKGKEIVQKVVGSSKTVQAEATKN